MIKWSYMDHWRSNGPSGPIDQWHSRRAMTRFLRQVAAVGYDAIDTFTFRIWQILEQYGSVANYQEFVQEQGLERVVNAFHGVYYSPERYAPELPETLPAMLDDFRMTMELWSGIQLDNVIVMPGSRNFDDGGITDDALKYAAEAWAKVGAITREYGVNLTCHHEFYCGIRTREQIDTFYRYADPEYVKFFVDTAQHCIADVDPVDVYDTHHARVTGFHFKDTRTKDVNEDYRLRPEAEVSAVTTEKWFYEMGTAEGLVDFEAMMRSVRDHGYTGWISVEHDKADKLGGDYAESTAIAAWYARNVLDGIYAEATR